MEAKQHGKLRGNTQIGESGLSMSFQKLQKYYNWSSGHYKGIYFLREEIGYSNVERNLWLQIDGKGPS